jgi:5-methylcytosine-specific restriction endonuclease McrA
MDYTQINLKHNILVLNSDYNPINICSARRAIILLVKQKAHMITQKVIRLVEYIRIPYSRMYRTKPSKNAIYKRDGYKCQYCSSTKNLTLDHIIPKSKGGKTTYSNLVVACSSCNTKKGNKFLEETNMTLLQIPREPKNNIEFTLLKNNEPEWGMYFYV